MTYLGVKPWRKLAICLMRTELGCNDQKTGVNNINRVNPSFQENYHH